MLRPLSFAGTFAGLLLTVTAPTQDPPQPATQPEASGHAATSSLADVQRFLDACVRLPHGDRLAVEVAGKSHEGRPLLLVRIALPGAPPQPRLRALVIGNIHAGECEGKEALQALVREFAQGQHEELLQQFELWFLPVYNADGNEAVGKQNRPGQNGPALTGRRANAQGFDLNRDFVKAEAPETQTLLALFQRHDPHLFVDLHTTNGSYHGYHLTYAPSLSPNLDPGLAALSRELLDQATARLQQQGLQSFDYGNFETRDWEGNGAPESPQGVRGWYTYDHRARYGVNYFGLRNRIAILSEAYSYDPFPTRIAATRAFVLALLHGLAARREVLLQRLALAEQRLVAPAAPVWFGSDTGFGNPERLPVLVGEVDTIPAADGSPVRYARRGTAAAEVMPVLRSFRSRRLRQLPGGWAIRAPSPAVVERLQRHGIRFAPVDGAAVRDAAVFQVAKQRKPKRPYQGHQELVLEGSWQPAQPTELPPGTLLVTARQPLARLAATLLEPESEDSLATWNFFEAATTDTFPVLRLVDAP